MFDDLTLVLRTYTRTFVSQGVGIIGLAWCLADGRAALSVVLAMLVLADQALFLRGRFVAGEEDFPFRRWLHGWCFAVSGFDVLFCAAALVRSAGLRDGAGGPATSHPIDCVAYVLAAFAHGQTTLAPATAGGRLLGGVLAVLGPLTILAVLCIAIGGRRRGE